MCSYSSLFPAFAWSLSVFFFKYLSSTTLPPVDTGSVFKEPRFDSCRTVNLSNKHTQLPSLKTP